MKGQAGSLREQHQRKEARRKEATMPTPNQHETEDQEKPRRAAIYLSEPVPDCLDEPRDELSIDHQLVLCRCVAKALQLEVIGVFADPRDDLALRPGLRQALAAAEMQRPDILIVSSLERLAESYHDIVKIAWNLVAQARFPYPPRWDVNFCQQKCDPAETSLGAPR
jgi:Resolvase, N terminal domain